jgi:hypothetical protein
LPVGRIEDDRQRFAMSSKGLFIEPGCAKIHKLAPHIAFSALNSVLLGPDRCLRYFLTGTRS